MADGWDSSMMRAALAVALERAGGEIEYTQTEFAPCARGSVSTSSPARSTARARRAGHPHPDRPSAAKQSMPVS